MRQVSLASWAAISLCAPVLYAVQAATPETAAHDFLQKLVGQWENDSEVITDPSQPAMKFKGTETGRAIGDSWVMLEIKTDSPIGATTGILTVGYDSEKKKIVGTWIDSASSYLWTYEGSLDAAGKVLTLDTEGPSPMTPGKRAKFQERIEFKDKDQRTFTSSVQGEKGEWTTFVTVNAKRKS
jgi:hypothetical protein